MATAVWWRSRHHRPCPHLNGESYTVVGVMPAAVDLPSMDNWHDQLWVPIAFTAGRSRQPGESLPGGDRANEAGRDAAAGAGGDDDDRGAFGKTISGGEHARRDPGKAIARTTGRRHQTCAARSPGRGRVRSADCLRERRKPAPGARGGAAKGNCVASRPGREPVPADAAISHGKRVARGPGRRCADCSSPTSG